ncbi:hypothetical protein ACA910_010851 [Epithemia clementina (nom. ined.)]
MASKTWEAGGGTTGGPPNSGRNRTAAVASAAPVATIVQLPPLLAPSGGGNRATKPAPSIMAAEGGAAAARTSSVGASSTSTSTSATTTTTTAAVLLDPHALLDSYDRARSTNNLRHRQQLAGSGGAATSAATTAATTLDPVQFLNQHYQTEAALTQQLSSLRDAVTGRMQSLEDRISRAIQRQSETAMTSRQSVQAAKAAVQTLSERIALVRDKAAQSEQAVLHITADMKLLDTSKRHLQRTITTLKRLHMLVHAVEELRLLAQQQRQRQPAAAVPGSTTAHHRSPASDSFQTASHLVQAIRILSRHFDIYQAKVPPLQKLGSTVELLQNDLLFQVVKGFRRAALGVEKAQQLEQRLRAERKQQRQQQLQQKLQRQRSNASIKTRQAAAKNTATTTSSISSPFVEDLDDDDDENNNNNETNPTNSEEVVLFTLEMMRGGVMYLDALGLQVRHEFIRNFCRDLLRPYVDDFTPPDPSSSDAKKATETATTTKRISSFKVTPPPPAESTSSDAAALPKGKKCFLDSVEQRFLWFRQVLEDELQPKFGPIFPHDWHVQPTLARSFLRLTHQHFIFLLTKGPKADANNAAILLKALQKTLVFEKEITAWLVRECKTEFATPTPTNKTEGDKNHKNALVGGEDLDDDEEEDNNGDGAFSPGTTITKKKKTTVDPLMGVASVAFDNYMAPYITLEEQSLSEQLAQALEDQTVDNRGELPVFISSTNLFVYIKGSITRCTALTKGKPFFQLYQAFSNALRKYASILDGKLPKPTNALSTSAMAGISIAGLGKSAASGSGTASESSSTESFKIPPGEEVIICHVVSTCEYCAETVEALEELIMDTMDDKLPYKSKVSMTADQEAFHDLTAKSIRVLVSGLIHRTQDLAIKQLLSTNWGQWESVGEESEYVRIIHQEVGPFCITAKKLLPLSYFRTFCDKFAAAFGAFYYDMVIRLKRISEPGTQQLLLDVYNLKTLFLKLPVLEESSTTLSSSSMGAGKKHGSTIAPAMYTKLVQKQFGKIETLLKLVGTPEDLLIDNFKSVVAGGGTAEELQIVMNLKGMKRPDQASFLEKFGLDPAKALKGATRGVSSASIVTERVQAVTSDLNQMRQKVDDFRKSFR